MVALKIKLGGSYKNYAGEICSIYKRVGDKFYSVVLPACFYEYQEDGRLYGTPSYTGCKYDLAEEIPNLDEYFAKQLLTQALSLGFDTIPITEEIYQTMSQMNIDANESLVEKYLELSKDCQGVEYVRECFGPNILVGHRYEMKWDDGGSTFYTVTDITMRDYGIIWDNGCHIRVNFGCGIHEKSILLGISENQDPSLIRLVHPEPEDLNCADPEDFQACARMMQLLNDDGFVASCVDVYSAWREYSDSVDAMWIIVPEEFNSKDREVFLDILKTYLKQP